MAAKRTRQTRSSGDMLAAALEYARRGWRVIPVNRSKQPATPHGYKDGTTDPGRIRKWFRVGSDLNVAIVTGARSGLAVVDFDGPPAPFAGPLLIPTPTAISGGGEERFHKYFRMDGSVKSFKFDGGDFLADGRYAVAPPSLHLSGRPYEWDAFGFLAPGEIALADLPQGIEGALSGISDGRCSRSALGVSRMGARKHILPCSHSEFPRRDLAREPRVAFAILARCGTNVVELGKPFLCPLHRERHASAALWFRQDDPEGIIFLHHFHGEPEWIALGDLYARCTYRVGSIGKGERVLWWIRTLFELEFIDLPDVPFPDLPAGAPKVVRRLFAGYVFLLRCREYYRPGQILGGTPFSWRFAMAWCRMTSMASVQRAIGWLLANDVIEVVPKALTGSDFDFLRPKGMP